jgi:WXG100 family type VII secretion target
MAGLRGGEIGQMHTMSKDFKAQAAEVQRVASQIERNVQSSNQIWTGPGAERFRSAWAQNKQAFQQMVQALEEASKGIKTYADNIEAATR